MNFKKLSQRLGLEESEYRELIELFTETTSSDLNTFQRAIRAKDTEQAARSVHSIIGAASSLGFTAIYEVARKIQEDIRNHRIQHISESVHILKNEVDVIAEYLHSEETFV